MQTTVYPFPSTACTVYHDAPLLALKEVLPGPAIVITDQHLMDAHGDRLRQWPCIVIPPGEQHKTQATADHIIERLIAAGADRQTTLIGVGGGVVTDITGYVASVYMRGIPVGFVPTSILAMVDAALGGKNGVDVGLYKNMVGTFRQPGFLWYDMSLLHTLPEAEWVNGFAEVIKHACIKDAALFDWLEQHHWQDCRADAALCAELVRRNSNIKAAVVVNDEREQGERKLLNFGHTIGHAVENLYRLPHGHAISIGMVAACQLSEELNGFASAQKERLVQLLQRYGLPTHWVFDKQKVMDILLKDKKKINQTIHFILLQAIGQSQVVPIGTTQLADLFEQVL